MEILQTVFQAEIIEKLGWTLVHFTWQGLAVGLVLAAVLGLLSRFSANVRYLTAFAALLLMVLLPVITLSVVDVSGPAQQVEMALSQGEVAEQMVSVPLTEGQDDTMQRTPSTGLSFRARFAGVVEPALPYLVVSWLMGIFGLSLWHLGGWGQLQKLRCRSVKRVKPELMVRLEQLCDRLGIRRKIEMLESALVQVPTVIGHFKPVILLPTSALTGLSIEQIEAVIAHELGHIKRHDYLVNILQSIVEILGFYHPAVWWVSRKIRIERENCCDDIAVSVCVDKVCFAKALTTMEEIRAGGPGLAVAASGGNLFSRICRLSGREEFEAKQNWFIPALVALLVGSVIVLASCQKTGTILPAYEQESEVSQISTEARFLMVPIDAPLFGDMFVGKEIMLSPEELDEFLKDVRTTPDARMIVLPKVSTVGGESAQMRVDDRELKNFYLTLDVKNMILPDDLIRTELEFKYEKEDQIKHMTNTTAVRSGHAFVIEGEAVDGKRLFLILKPEILERESVEMQ